MADKTFLDANAVMELFFGRTKQSEVEDLLALWAQDRFAVSLLTAGIFFYHVEKYHADKQGAHAFLGGYELLDVNAADYAWAKANDQGDFEDALQVACALRHGCKKLITLDADLAAAHRKHIAVKLVQ